jgi:vanillate O-demethylase monooxygenase subunit
MSALADRHTPFIFNEWYVAAFGADVGRSLLARTLLGQRVVLFRTTEGSPVAMEDRCPHRSYPLSLGRLDGDTIVCGYHGFRYDSRGDCIEVPAMPNCPRNIGTRAYPLAERGPLLWIWMGDPALADESLIEPMPWTTSSDWGATTMSYQLRASYVSLHENLLDTGHASFLHANTIGEPDYVRAPTQQEQSPGRFTLIRTISPTTLPPIFGRPTGLEGRPTITRIARSDFLSPALYVIATTLFDGALNPSNRPEFHLRVSHMPTPETQTSCHYFLHIARDFAPDDSDISSFISSRFSGAFKEDVDALNLIEEIYSRSDGDFYEMSVGSDSLTLAMRRYLKERAEKEALLRSQKALSP